MTKQCAANYELRPEDLKCDPCGRKFSEIRFYMMHFVRVHKTMYDPSHFFTNFESTNFVFFAYFFKRLKFSKFSIEILVSRQKKSGISVCF